MRLLRSLVTIASALVFAASTAVSSPPAATAAGCSWNRVRSPNAGSGDNGLSGVTAVSATDAWVVGAHVGSGGMFRTLAEHWDGERWSVVPTPNIGSFNNHLDDVAAAGPNDVWAVGAHDGDAGVLVEHWDGVSWSKVAAPDPGSSRNLLLGVAVISSTDAWAVGYQSDGGNRETLAEHWDGKSWSVVPMNNRGTGENLLYSVTAVSPTDVWAVGYSDDPAGGSDTLIERWDGTSWRIAPSPNGATGGSNELHGVAAVSATEVWAVGTSYDGILTRTLTERWNGTTWVLKPSPNPGSNFNELWGVANTSTGIRAAGDWNGGFDQPYHPLVLHRTATTWDVEATPLSGVSGAMLFGIAGVPGADTAWAVGQADASGVFRTLILRRC